ELDAAQLAAVAHLSPSRLSHLFTAQVGTSLARYVEAQRLELAARLLEMTTDPVAEVARRAGFRDPLYFSRRFRTLRGVSPSEHRARHRGAAGAVPLSGGRARSAGSEPFSGGNWYGT